MKISVVNYNEVIEIMPNIEGDDTYSIIIGFDNGERMCYGYASRKRFLHDYKRLMLAWTRYDDD